MLPSTPKSVRLSIVAVSAAAMAVVWALLDEFALEAISPVIVSTVTSLVMLLSQFYDIKHKFAGDVVIDPRKQDDD